jgi:hypothetical protein
MADNKKPNYAAALKAQAKKPVAKEDSDEVIYVDVGGEVTPLHRGKGADRMEDAKWDRLKQRAAQQEADSLKAARDAELGKKGAEMETQNETRNRRRKAFESLPDIENYQYGSDSLIPDKQTHVLLKKLSPNDRVEYFEDRAKKLEYRDEEKSKGETIVDDGSAGWGIDLSNDKQRAAILKQQAEKDAAPAAQNSPRGMQLEAFKGFDDLKKDQGSPETDFAAAPNQAGRTVNDAVDNVQLPASKGSGMMMPELNIAPEGLDPRGSNPKLNEAVQRLDLDNVAAANAARNLDPRGSNPKLNALAAKQANMQFYDGSVPEDEGYVEPGTPSTFDQFAHAIAQVPQQIGSLFSGDPSAAANQARQTVDDAADNAQLPASKGSGSGSGSTSVSVSGRSPGGAPSLKPLDLTEQQRMMAEGYATQNMANALMAEQQSDLLSKKANLVRQQQDEAAQLQARQASMESARAERMKKGAAGLAALQTRLADLEQQAPDPNRFWNNKDAGQKAAAVIAGALFGFTGQGMQWLQRLDGLVERDIQQQAAELQRKGGLLGKQIDVQNNLVGMARQEGLDEAESISAARIAMTNNYALQFEAAAATTGSEQVKAQALANAGILRQKMAQEQADMAIKTNKAAQDAALTAAQVSHLNAQTYAARVAASAKGTGDNKLAPGTREEIAKIDKGLEAIKQAREALQGGNKLTDQIANNLRKGLDFIGQGDLGMFLTPDTTGRTAVAESAQETALKGVMGEALQEKDIERNRPRFARPGLNSDNTKWLDSQEEVLIRKRNSLVGNNSESDLSVTPSNRITTERPAR